MSDLLKINFGGSYLHNYTVALLLCIMSLIGCRPATQQPDDPSKRILAQVHNKILYLGDMEGMFPQNCSAQDSNVIVNNFIEKWVRDNVLMHEAERSIPNDLDIDELVRDYRASLIKHNFEKSMVDLMMDSIVSPTELVNFYENNKEQYRLSSTILRCHLIKVPRKVDDLSTLKKLWRNNKEEDYPALLEYCTKNAEVYMLTDSIWYKKEDIAIQLPQGSLSSTSIRTGKELTLKDNTHRYYFRVLEAVKAKEIAPLEYVKEQLTKVILHNRKIELLTKKREELYDRELRRNNVKVFVKND